jgi:hypothetical protein
MTNQAKQLALPPDDRLGQAERTTDFMEQHPEGVTVSQIKAATDPGSPTKLLSVMRNELGYVIRRQRSHEICQGGTKQRPCWLFFLVSRPTKQQQDLFDPQ